MQHRTVRALQSAVGDLQSRIREELRPPSDSQPSPNQPILPFSLVKGTRGYIETVSHQINQTYTVSCYDACAVMIRRLIEILIIECFEHHCLSPKIRNNDGDYFLLGELINRFLDESTWSLGRNTKRGLKKMKTIGDQSAHSRHFNARRQYVDDIVMDLRVAVEELLYIAGLKT